MACSAVGYSGTMLTDSLPADTSSAAQAIVLERLTSMTMSERANAAQELNDMCRTLSIAGIRAQHGEVTGDDLRWHLAFRRYGKSLADEVYGTR